METLPLVAEPRRLPGPKRANPLDLLRYVRDPRGTLQRIVGIWGDPFSWPDPSSPTVFTGDPEAVEAVFRADPDGFDIPLRDQVGPFFGQRSLILTCGARHRTDRKLLMPPFHGARMRTWGATIVDETRAAAARWQPGRPFVMLEQTQAISLEVILRVVFGVESDARRGQFREAVGQLVDAMASPIITMFPVTRRQLGGLGPWARYLRARARFDALVYEEIEARRGRTDVREDILSSMMAARYDDGSVMSDGELRDQLHLLLFAGHDTTATALAWAFHLLHRHPGERERLLVELDALGPEPTPDAVAALPFLEAVCRETLRIHPVVMNVGRLLKEPLVVKGCTVPAGTTVMISSLLLHDREELYPEPRVFRPQRFLDRKFTPFEYVPFGGGARRCLGAALAMYEMKLVLGTLTREHHLRGVGDAPVKPVIRGLTMGPKGGVPIVLDGPRDAGRLPR